MDLERDFELKKRNLREDVENVNIHISAALVEVAKDKTGKTIPELIEASGMADKIRFRRDRATFKAEIIRELFAPSVKSIVDHVKSVISSKQVEQVDKILMVGGFSESQTVMQAVKDAFPDVMVVAPLEPGLAVVKGAVIFGHAPDSISTRVSRYAYGVAAQGEFIPNMHPEHNRIEVNGKECCKDLFSKLVSLNDSVDSTQKIERIYGVEDKNATVCIEIYASENEYPVLVNDPGCTKIGQLIIKPPLGGWRKNAELKIELGFGGTEVTVTATETQTLNEYVTSFDCLS